MHSYFFIRMSPSNTSMTACFPLVILNLCHLYLLLEDVKIFFAMNTWPIMSMGHRFCNVAVAFPTHWCSEGWMVLLLWLQWISNNSPGFSLCWCINILSYPCPNWHNAPQGTSIPLPQFFSGWCLHCPERRPQRLVQWILANLVEGCTRDSHPVCLVWGVSLCRTAHLLQSRTIVCYLTRELSTCSLHRAGHWWITHVLQLAKKQACGCHKCIKILKYSV